MCVSSAFVAKRSREICAATCDMRHATCATRNAEIMCAFYHPQRATFVWSCTPTAFSRPKIEIEFTHQKCRRRRKIDAHRDTFEKHFVVSTSTHVQVQYVCADVCTIEWCHSHSLECTRSCISRRDVPDATQFSCQPRRSDNAVLSFRNAAARRKGRNNAH